MKEGSARTEAIGNTRRGWDQKHSEYVCEDTMCVVPIRTFRIIRWKSRKNKRNWNSREDEVHVEMVLRNMVAYQRASGSGFRSRLFVSEVVFDRKLSQIRWTKKDVKTIAFPGTTRKVLDYVFFGATVRSVVLNEGLEKLGRRSFMDSSIQRVTIPASVIVVGAEAFCNCRRLKSVNFTPGS